MTVHMQSFKNCEEQRILLIYTIQPFIYSVIYSEIWSNIN